MPCLHFPVLIRPPSRTPRPFLCRISYLTYDAFLDPADSVRRCTRIISTANSLSGGQGSIIKPVNPTQPRHPWRLPRSRRPSSVPLPKGLASKTVDRTASFSLSYKLSTHRTALRSAVVLHCTEPPTATSFSLLLLHTLSVFSLYTTSAHLHHCITAYSTICRCATETRSVHVCHLSHPKH